ncbi:hypothetical protein [Micromonospora sp. ATCC 39149]|uniref:hypothetical protein n=1 Tax=Micromonospora sp. (strain ATCC 39149 / NRRL 15099 / SCC 1413) TaxID=219305 RepID=UPI0002E7CBAA|nr:hypothetical protein [Micromonospora sp. ATCC 39149]
MAELAKGDPCPECGTQIEKLVPYEGVDITHPRRARASYMHTAIQPCGHTAAVEVPYHGPTVF